ncbi:MAG: copper resistance protein CopZ [Ruminococcaceae bacterium]|nr:copper resistance protein CopZ [Oscillospiraceae bacterium]
MLKIVLKIEGMACGMCEAHVNDVIRRAFSVKKVTSSHKNGETVILTKEDIADERLMDVVRSVGYTLATIRREPYEKTGLFARFAKK